MTLWFPNAFFNLTLQAYKVLNISNREQWVPYCFIFFIFSFPTTSLHHSQFTAKILYNLFFLFFFLNDCQHSQKELRENESIFQLNKNEKWNETVSAWLHTKYIYDRINNGKKWCWKSNSSLQHCVRLCLCVCVQNQQNFI